MSRRAACLFLLVLGLFPAQAAADVSNRAASNVQEGDNDHSSDQSGAANTGDAVGGQVVGVVSSGDASLDATNRSESSEVESGDATGTNHSGSATGLINATCGGGVAVDIVCPPTADITNAFARNVQEGDNGAENVQAADVFSGDGVAGQVIGVVTSGSADLVTANTTIDSEIGSGDADFANENTVVGGHLSSSGPCCNIPTDAAGIDVF